MKRRNQGYVLALVLVVTLLLSSVASLLTVSVVRNIQAGGSTFADMAEAEPLNGMIEQYFAHLKYKESKTDPLGSYAQIDFAQDAFTSALHDFSVEFVGEHTPADPKALLSIGDAVQTVLDAEHEQYCYLIPVQASLYEDTAQTIGPVRSATAIISISVTYIETAGEEGDGPSYQLVFDSVEYKSYRSA